MSDTTIAVDTSAVAKKSNPAGKPADGVDAELVSRLVEQARAAGLQLVSRCAAGSRMGHCGLLRRGRIWSANCATIKRSSTAGPR
ncbi:hypothetical protein [Micromonospora sp. NPDC005206]